MWDRLRARPCRSMSLDTLLLPPPLQNLMHPLVRDAEPPGSSGTLVPAATERESQRSVHI